MHRFTSGRAAVADTLVCSSLLMLWTKGTITRAPEYPAGGGGPPYKENQDRCFLVSLLTQGKLSSAGETLTGYNVWVEQEQSGHMSSSSSSSKQFH